MTTEEKAKRFDEVVDEFRGLLEGVHEDKCDIMEEDILKIVPELKKESEDEKVKRILHSISSKMSFHLPDIFTEEEFQCFDTLSNAWLERQGRKESDPRYENLEELLAADDIYQMAMNDAMVNEAKEKAVNALSEMCIWRLLGLEKKGKSKFEQCIQDGDKIVTNEDGTHFNISQLERVVKKESNPAWSEEDEEELEIIIDFLNSPSTAELCPTLRSNTIDWLKSLKDRVQSQPQWKPSDDQIAALRRLINLNIADLYDYRHLKRLLEQLEKL